MSRTPQNYKQKWLAALENHRVEPVTHAANETLRASSVQTTGTDAAIVLRRINGRVGEMAGVAKSLVDEMDSHQSVAGLTFGEVGGEIDTKLARMPVDVAMRRLRDLLKLAEARIAMLTIHADDLHIANTNLTESLKKAANSSKNVERALLEVAWIGPNPTANEIQDFNDASAGEYHRDNLHYEDLDEEYVMTKLFSGTSLRTVARRTPDLTDDQGEDDSDTSSDEAEKKIRSMPSPVRNRHARIVPSSPTTTRNKVDI